MERFGGGGGRIGRLTEEELFGSVKTDKYRKDYEAKIASRQEFVRNYEKWLEKTNPFGDMLVGVKQLVKDCQPNEDPTEPEKRFSRDLYGTIAESLKLDDYQKLRFYTAVNSHLDKKGTDAFFELDTARGTIEITLDVTLNPAKGDAWKADVVFLWPKEGLDPKADKEAYLKKVQEISAEIMYAIRKQGGP